MKTQRTEQSRARLDIGRREKRNERAGETLIEAGRGRVHRRLTARSFRSHTAVVKLLARHARAAYETREPQVGKPLPNHEHPSVF